LNLIIIYYLACSFQYGTFVAITKRQQMLCLRGWKIVFEPPKRITTSSFEPSSDSKKDELSQIITLINNLRHKQPAIFRHIIGIMKAILKE